MALTQTKLVASAEQPVMHTGRKQQQHVNFFAIKRVIVAVMWRFVIEVWVEINVVGGCRHAPDEPSKLRRALPELQLLDAPVVVFDNFPQSPIATAHIDDVVKPDAIVDVI